MGPFDDTDRRQWGPPRPDAALAEVAARQHGVVSLAQLRMLGLGARGAQHRVSSGRLHRVHRGIYAVGHPLLSADGMRMAAVLACGPSAVLSHRSAAAVWGLRASASGRIDVTTPDRGRKGPSGVTLHRTRRLEAADVTRLRGIPITSVARTLVDLADVLTPDRIARAIHEAEVLRLLDVRAVTAALDRAGGRRGAGCLLDAIAEPSPGPTRSELERRFLALCRGGRLPLPRLNLTIPLGDRLIEVDALWPQERLVVELDGADVHGTRRAFHADRCRDSALAAEGYLVIRLTWHRVTREREAVLGELRRILDVRGGRGVTVPSSSRGR